MARRTYRACINGLVPAASCTDLFTITGAAGKLIRVSRLRVGGTQTTGGFVDVFLTKRSAANSGGTSTNPTKVPVSSSSAAADATLNAYTANPTTGALVGNLGCKKLSVPAATAAVDPEAEWDFRGTQTQMVELRNAQEVLAVNLGGVTVTGGSFTIEAEWTESG